MNKKRDFLRYITAVAVAIAVAIAIVVIITFYEINQYGNAPEQIPHFVSDGFFTAAVFYIGFGLLTLISDAGNFYGISYLGYSLLYIFSPRKDRFEGRKDYFTYCTEKKAKQKHHSGAPVKWVLLAVGGVCMVISFVLAMI